ncbi:hypothetical protein J4G43_030255 [Bradyrhizobium barranii subsp. barranii]|uniref:Uncharacterized protein n=1 Tax=Bradyrhizobium barranii subsp. barranii TaxID=2823807 RepID=A0A939M955_9BRAD|nr:hypothetical protein [Bradyrhizobium barranii]UEM09023.1 hypothetical protein J4G43_030255 [Bradyrhizobium barranii subsp. barranii]
MRRYKVSVTTDGSGNATAYSPRIAGEIHSIQYVKDGSNGYANGVDFTITAEATGENIWTQADVNASAVVYPRAATHSQAGVAALYAAGGTGVFARIGMASDRVKISLAQGGATKLGAFHILVA